MKLKALTTLSFVCISLITLAQKSYEDGLAAFLENDRETAIELLNESITNGEQVAESHLVLSYIYTMVEKDNDAFSHFEQMVAALDNPYPYITALFNSGDIGLGSSKKDEVRLAFLQRMVDDPQTPGKLRMLCLNSLGDHFLNSRDFKSARSYYDQIGSIDNWSAVGPFENLSASGFNKDVGVLSNPSASHTFTSRYGANIKWFEVYGPRIDKWLDYEYFFATSNAVIYSQTFVKSPKKQKVQLRLGVSGSVKMWLNDHLIFSEKEERNNFADSYIIETELEKGSNRIVLQIGESEADNCNSMLRITDSEGYAISGLTSKPFGSAYAKEVPVFKEIPNAEEQFFEALVEKDPSVINRVLLSTAYLGNDKQYMSRKVLNQAIEEAPNSSYLKINLANIYIREGNRTGMAMLLEWLKDNDLSNPVSIGLTFEEALENEEYELADSLLNLYVKRFGYSEEYYEYSIDLAIEKDENEYLLILIEEAYAAYRDVEKFVNLKALLEQSVNKRTSKAIKIMKKYLKRNFSVSMHESLANNYFRKNDLSSGLEEYTGLLEEFPYYVGTYYDLANIHYAIRSYSAALNYIEKCIELAPYADTYWGTKGEILQEMGDYTDAEEAYERAIELYPNNYDVRESLRLLNDEESVFELFEEEDYYEVFKNTPSAEDYPDDNSLIVRYETQKVVYEGGGSEEKVILLVKMLNTAGIDNWKEYTIPIYNFQEGLVEKVEVIKASGSKLEAEREGANVVFTNLEPGDGILIIYRVKNHYFGKLAFNIWEQHPFQLNYPVLNNSYSLLVDPKLKFNYEFSNGGFEPEVTKTGGFDRYVWSKGNVPALRSEDYMSRHVDFVEYLFISTFPDWTYISNWYSDLAATKSTPDFEVKELVQSLFEGKEGLTDREKVETIYKYIITNIRYSSVSFRQSGLIPQKASDVLNTKIGDCKDVSTLFVSMCKEAGIEDVGLVLINTRDNGRKDLILPSISFNHCVARVNLEGVDYYVELTSENNSFLTYGDNLINSYALNIYDENEDVETEAFYFNPENRNENSVYRTSRVKVNGENLDMEVDNVKTGNWAAYMRYRYKDESEEEQREVMLGALNNDYKSVDLDRLEFGEFDSLTNKFEYTYTFTIKGAVSKIAGLNIFEVPWNDSYETSELVSDENREYPIELWRYFNYDKKFEEITITLPSGKRLAERPKNVYIDNEFATYSIKYKVVGSTITATRTMTPKTQVVQPEDFEKLKDFMDQVISHDNKSLAYR